MAPMVHTSLPTVTTTRVELGPGRMISTHDFLRGLRRPKPKDTAPSALAQIVPNANGESLEHIPKVVSLEDPRPSRAGHDRACDAEDLRGDHFGLLEAPKVTRTYLETAKLTSLQEERLMDSSPLFCSQGHKEGEDELGSHFQSRNRTHAATSDRKNARIAEASNTITGNSLMKPDDHRPQSFSEQQSDEAPATRLNSQAKHAKRKARKQKSKNKGRKKRRAPVNQLVLKPSLPADAESLEGIQNESQFIPAQNSENEVPPREDLDDLDLALLGEIDEYGSTEIVKSKPPKDSNIGKPVTRMRKELSVPRHHKISHEGFKFPLATPRPERNPGWKLGSGFEGIELENATMSTIKQTYNTVIKRPKRTRYQTPNSRALQLSTNLSPSLPARNYSVMKAKLDLNASISANGASSPVENCELHPIPKAGTISTVGSPHHEQMHVAAQLCRPVDSCAARGPQNFHKPVPQTLCRESNKTTYDNVEQSPNTRAIRKPSKLEQSGWLKRRRKVSFVTASDEQIEPVNRTFHPGLKDESIEDILDQHNATCCGESPLRAGLSRASQNNFSHQRDDTDHHQGLAKADSAHTIKGKKNNSNLLTDSIEGQNVIPIDGSLSQTSRQLYPLRERSRDLGGSPLALENKASSRVSWSKSPIATSSGSLEIQDSQEERIPVSSKPRMNIVISPLANDINQTARVPSNLGFRFAHEIPQTRLNASRYIPNAIQQLSSPIKAPPPISARKSKRQAGAVSSPNMDHDQHLPITFSTQQGSHGVNVISSRGLGRARTEGGNLELGMTPRLQRNMSNFPFRPPFKAFT